MPEKNEIQSDYLVTTYQSPAQPGNGTSAATPPPPTPWQKQRRPRRFTRKRIILSVVGIFLLAVLGTGGWLGYKFVQNTLKATKGNLLGILSTSKLTGESTGRVNILLAGNSADDPGHGGGELTDSIIIASIDVTHNSAFILSIPRDTWVSIPGYGHQKINAVYPAGGMDLLEKVVERDFGVTIHYTTLVNYTAFKQAVDAVGGIKVTIKSSDPRGIYDPNIAVNTGGAALLLKNGPQTLNGQTALNLARARNDPTPSGKTGYGLPGGDFDRAANQRLMLLALKDKAASLSTLSNPVKITELLDAIGDNVTTSFTPSDLRRLYELAQKIPNTQVQSLSLQDAAHGINLLSNFTSSSGQAALMPAAGLDDFSDIKRYIRQVSSSDPVVKENARVVILNGSGVAGRAKTQAETLEAKNYSVASYGNAPTTIASTQIITVTTTKTASLKALKSLLGVSATTTNATLSAQYPNADIIVVLGSNGTVDAAASQ